jgi:Zn-finger nucleic acid-binding protein
MTVATSSLRCLVACASCGRQYDATGFAAGSRFHCSCGSLIEVPRFRANDAAVVRCSSCGAARERSAPACAHCGADYTLHERDLHTLCPTCMTRVSDRARFCHHCATPIVPQGQVGAPTRHGCPACGRRRKLHSRALGQPAVALLECPRCAGVWLSREAFDLVAERARDRTLPERLLQPTAGAEDAAGDQAPPRGATYRSCPHCHGLMNRRNYGKRSGVVVDVCKDHGIWFDARELEAVVRFIRTGGEAASSERDRAEEAEAERRRRIGFPALERAERAGGGGAGASGRDGLDLVGGLIESLFELS